MRYNIVSTELSTSDDFTKAIEKKMFGIVEKTKVPFMRRRVSLAVQKAAESLPGSIEAILERGVGPLQAGNRTVDYASPLGDGRFKTKSWQKLKNRYAKSKPKSKKFWMKHPGGGSYKPWKNADHTVETLLSLFRRATAGAKVKVRSSRPTTASSGKRSKRITWDVNMTTSAPYVLQEMMYLAMLRGVTHKTPQAHEILGSISKNDITKIAYVEGRRPLIRGVSHAIGKKLKTRIKAEMRPKI